jgi:Fe-S cluster biosynthesis and repair protein YggX
VRLKKQAEALDKAPYPGELGLKILQQVSKQGWQEWLKFQTILINENELSPINPKDRAFLEQQMDNFFFGDGGKMPAAVAPVVTLN